MSRKKSSFLLFQHSDELVAFRPVAGQDAVHELRGRSRRALYVGREWRPLYLSAAGGLAAALASWTSMYDVFNVETGEGMMAQWDTNPGNKQETFRNCVYF